jgi:hypothetical protein
MGGAANDADAKINKRIKKLTADTALFMTASLQNKK